MRRKTPEEVAWLLENAPLRTHAEGRCLFAERFGWEISPASYASWMSSHGLRAANSPMRWTPEMDGFFREIVPGHAESEIAELFEGRFGIRLNESQIGNRKNALGVRSGTFGGRFKPGHVPANKGKTWDEAGISPEAQERMRTTCFKKGGIPKSAEGKPIGYERVNRDGYVEVKVKDGAQGEANENFRMKHQVVWEEANGLPVPPSTMIVFADHDKRNFDPGNLVAVPRSVWAVICHSKTPYHDRETLEAAMALAELQSSINAARCRPRRCWACGSEFKPEQPRQRTCRPCLDAGRRAPTGRSAKRRKGKE